MRRFLRSLCVAILIVVVTIVLGAVGVVMDQQMFAEREGEVVGHAVPVFTMVLPMLWLSFLFWINAIRSLVEFFRSDVPFLKNGFKKSKSFFHQQVYITINGEQYKFPLITNRKQKIKKYDFCFAVAIRHSGERVLFVNKSFNPSFEDNTAAYRTAYKGLMKKPYLLVYPFEQAITIHTDDGLLIHGMVQ